MDSLYKSILKNYSIKLADTTNAYDSSKEWIYTKIFYTLEEYIENILSLKVENYDEEFKGIKRRLRKIPKFYSRKVRHKRQYRKKYDIIRNKQKAIYT